MRRTGKQSLRLVYGAVICRNRNCQPTKEDSLTAWWREHAKLQPGSLELKSILVKLGGSHLVPPEGGLPLLIQCGFIMTGPVLLQLMEPNACHLNSSQLWVEKKLGVVGIGTGNALSDDGIWRQHSWGVRRERLRINPENTPAK